jgi:hypothetical protein
MNMNNLQETIRGWIRGKEYADLHPSINARNVFSISTLAYSVEKQVEWKLKGEREGHYVNTRMWAGKAKHEYIQARLASMREGWHFEKEVAFGIPYTWQNWKLNGLVLLGHIDAIRYEPLEIFELKTSDLNYKSVPEWAIRQAGAYGAVTLTQMRKMPKVYAVMVNSDVIVKELTPAEVYQAGREIQDRAYEAAIKVDVP